MRADERDKIRELLASNRPEDIARVQREAPELLARALHALDIWEEVVKVMHEGRR